MYYVCNSESEQGNLHHYLHQNTCNSSCSIKEERVGETYRFSFPSTAEYIFHRLITPAVKQHQGGMLPGLTYFLSQWFTSAWDHCYCSIPPTKLALQEKEKKGTKIFHNRCKNQKKRKRSSIKNEATQ